MNKSQLFTKINKLCKKMDKDYYINSGGCCFVAACIAENLEKLNIPFEIIHYDVIGCHYCIKVSDRYLNRDGYGIQEKVEDDLDNSEELFQRYYKYSWNELYNRKYNLIVRTRINSVFINYVKSLK